MIGPGHAGRSISLGLRGGPIWRVEWALALRRRRLFGMNMGIPMLLVLPLALGGAPVFHAAAAYAVLFVLFGTMGSAIPLLREGEGGLLRRTMLTGYPPFRLVGERVLANSAIDLLQLGPCLLLILALGRAPLPLWLLGAALLALALLAANLVGVWIAALARSLAEGALFAAVASLFLLHGAGVFRTPAPGSWGAVTELFIPFGALHRLLLQAAGGQPAPGDGSGLVGGTAATFTAFTVTLLVSGFLIRRLAPAHE